METKPKQPEVLETKKTDVYLLDPRNIEIVEGFNVREDYGDMKWLTEDIRENGVKIPLRVHKKTGSDGIYILTDGHRRLKAAMQLISEGVEDLRVPAICEPRGYNDESRIIDMFTLSEGNKQLNAVEQAKVIGRLIGYGMEVKDIAVRIHKSQAYISNLIQLNQAPTKIKKLISNNFIKATLVSEILREEKNYDKALEKIETECQKKGIPIYESGNIDDDSAEKEKKPEKKKVTKKDFQKSKGKVNSASHLKKFMKYFDKLQLKLNLDENKTEKAIEELIPKEKQEVFSVLRGIYEGVITIDSLKQLFDLAEEPVTEKTE